MERLTLSSDLADNTFEGYKLGHPEECDSVKLSPHEPHVATLPPNAHSLEFMKQWATHSHLTLLSQHKSSASGVDDEALYCSKAGEIVLVRVREAHAVSSGSTSATARSPEEQDDTLSSETAPSPVSLHVVATLPKFDMAERWHPVSMCVATASCVVVTYGPALLVVLERTESEAWRLYGPAKIEGLREDSVFLGCATGWSSSPGLPASGVDLAVPVFQLPSTDASQSPSSSASPSVQALMLRVAVEADGHLRMATFASHKHQPHPGSRSSRLTVPRLLYYDPAAQRLYVLSSSEDTFHSMPLSSPGVSHEPPSEQRQQQLLDGDAQGQGISQPSELSSTTRSAHGTTPETYEACDHDHDDEDLLLTIATVDLSATNFVDALKQTGAGRCVAPPVQTIQHVRLGTTFRWLQTVSIYSFAEDETSEPCQTCVTVPLLFVADDVHIAAVLAADTSFCNVSSSWHGDQHQPTQRKRMARDKEQTSAQPLTHVASLAAMEYVQASKRNKKFILSSVPNTDDSASASRPHAHVCIADATNQLYIYNTATGKMHIPMLPGGSAKVHPIGLQVSERCSIVLTDGNVVVYRHSPS